MTYVPLGRSGLHVSRMCLGAMNFGATWGFGTDETEARAIVDAFVAAGNNFIDTADTYSDGTSEEFVGRAVRGRRDSVVVATKGFMPHGEGPNCRGLSRVHLTRAVEASLRRLGTDYIDLYQCHNHDPNTPIEETMATLDGLVRSGKVRYVGCSNFAASEIVEAQWAARRLGATPFVGLQSQYSLLNREIEAEVLPVCARYGLGALAWGPLGGGILAGRYRRGAQPEPDTRLSRLGASDMPAARRWADSQLGDDRNFDIADEVVAIAAELDTSPAAVALAWILRRSGVTSVIIGPRTLEQCKKNLAAADVVLPDELVERLDAASGPAPRPLTGSAFGR